MTNPNSILAELVFSSDDNRPQKRCPASLKETSTLLAKCYNLNRHIEKLQTKPPDDVSTDYPSTFSWLGETIDIEPQPIWQQRTTRQWRQLYLKNLLRLQQHLGQHIQQQQILLQSPIESVQPANKDLSLQVQQFSTRNQQCQPTELQKLLVDKPGGVPAILPYPQRQSTDLQQRQNVEMFKNIGALFDAAIMNASPIAPHTVNQARLESNDASNSVPTLEMPSSVGSIPSAGESTSSGGLSGRPGSVLDCENYNDVPLKQKPSNKQTFNDLICSEAMPAQDSMIQPTSVKTTPTATLSSNNFIKSALVAEAMSMKLYPFATKRTKCVFCDRSLATSSLQRHINRFHPDLTYYRPPGRPAKSTS